MPLPPVPDLGAIRFLKDRDIGGVLNATIVFLRQNVREVLVGFLAIVGPVALAAGLASALYIRQVGDLLADPFAVQDPAALGELFGATYVGTLAFGFLTSIVSQAAAAGFVRLYRLGEAGEITVGALWEETKDLILPAAGVNLAVFAAVIASFVLVIIPCLGALAWLGLAIWVTPYVVVTFAARMVESPSLAAAWARARVLVKGSWSGAFWPMFLAAVVGYLLMMALYIPVYVAAGLTSANTVAENPAEMFGTLGVAMAPLQVLTVVVYLVPLVAAFFVHGKLVEELEGTTIVDDLDALADASAASRWGEEAGATRPEQPAPDAPDSGRSTPPASGPEVSPEDEPQEGAPRGFRGGGFGGPDA